jgi:hypothetical protein
MTDFCSPLQSQDTDAFKICGYLRDHGTTLSQIDQGVARPNFNARRDSFVVTDDAAGRSTRGNGVPEVAEIYREAIEAAERAFTARGPAAFCGGRFNDFLTFMERETGLRVSYLPSGGTGNAEFDRRLCALLSHPERLVPAGTPPGTRDYRYKLAQGLYQFFSTDLGILYSSEEAPDLGYREVSRIFRDRKWNCLESYVFGNICRLAGIEAVPIEDLSGQHVLMALKLNPRNPSELTFVDFGKGGMGFDASIPADGWVQLPKNDLLAYVHLNRAFPVDNQFAVDAASRQMQKAELDRALRLAPANFRVQYQIGLYHYLGGERALARRYFQESARLNPFFRPARTMLLST